MKSSFRILILMTIAAVVIASGCYVYTNPWDPLAKQSDIDNSSVSVTYDADAEDDGFLVIDWMDVNGIETGEDEWNYSVIGAETSESFIYEDYSNCEYSIFETGWGEQDWRTWNDLYFRIGYRVNNIDGRIWSEVFHYPMNYFNPMDEGITLTTTPKLSWLAVPGADSYEIDYAKSLSGLDGVPEESTADTSIYSWEGYSISVGDTIYWRIRAKTDDQELTTHFFWGRTSSFTVKSAPEVGDRYAGGYVFYLDGGGNGMIVTDQLIAEEVRWGSVGNDIAGDDNLVAPELTGIGAGQANTSAINLALGVDAVASKTCTDLIYRGFSDWYLPSLDELEAAESSISAFHNDDFREGVSEGPGLWSSSEYDEDNVYVVHSSASYTRYKQGLHNLLAVRDFTY